MFPIPTMQNDNLKVSTRLLELAQHPKYATQRPQPIYALWQRQPRNSKRFLKNLLKNRFRLNRVLRLTRACRYRKIVA
jgi:hypothetical protein